MFGKRGSDDGTRTTPEFRPAAPAAPNPQPAAARPPEAARPAGAAQPAPAAPVRRAVEAPPLAPDPKRSPTRERSEAYYDTKSQVFSALIATLDLSQLAKLDHDSAREEIRDIVNDIIAIKNFAMSIA